MKSSRKIVLLFVLFFICNVNTFAKADKTYDKLGLMVDVMEMIGVDYVSETKPEDLAVGAIKGVVAALKDPYCQYMEEKEYEKFKNELEGYYVGIGLISKVQNDRLVVILPMLGTPAYKAGILPKDIIIKIDGKSTKGMPYSEAVSLMRGKVGKKVKLTIVRSDVLNPMEFNLVRKKIKSETMVAKMLDNGIAYVKLMMFNAQSADDIKKALTDYRKQGVKSLILDLRDNLGGLVDPAINIASIFIKEKKLVVSTKGRTTESKKEYFTSGNGEFSDLEFIILINKYSASASEVLSGAMQDYKRALIMGCNTFGKGVIQETRPLPKKSTGALVLTIAKYYLPSGRSINRSDDKDSKNGITPDVDVEVEVSKEDEERLCMQEYLISMNDKYQKATSAKNKHQRSAVDKEKKVEDKVLNKAIEIIKENKIAEKITSSKATEIIKENKTVEKTELSQPYKKKK
ncbi:peptidase S41 [Endomicrobiia bacterium]|nr:peptidase S41 [Endomicrobiia bacterium]